MEEQLPPACAFAISVLAEHDKDPDAVPEEAIEAAQQHIVTCPRCKQAFHPSPTATEARKKKRSRKAASSSNGSQPTSQAALQDSSQEPSVVTIKAAGPASNEGTLSCLQCRELFPEYVEALESGQNVALLYPELQEHLLTCKSGCLMLLELLLQDAKKTRKDPNSPIYNPFKVIGWEFTGFFRSGL